MNDVLRMAGSGSGGRIDFKNIRRIINLSILGLFVPSRFVLSQFTLSRLIDLHTQSETTEAFLFYKDNYSEYYQSAVSIPTSFLPPTP